MSGPEVIVLALIGLWIWSLVHCVLNPRLTRTIRIIGILVIVLLAPIGSMIYLFLPRIPHATQPDTSGITSQIIHLSDAADFPRPDDQSDSNLPRSKLNDNDWKKIVECFGVAIFVGLLTAFVASQFVGVQNPNGTYLPYLIIGSTAISILCPIHAWVRRISNFEYLIGCGCALLVVSGNLPASFFLTIVSFLILYGTRFLVNIITYYRA